MEKLRGINLTQSTYEELLSCGLEYSQISRLQTIYEGNAIGGPEKRSVFGRGEGRHGFHQEGFPGKALRTFQAVCDKDEISCNRSTAYQRIKGKYQDHD